MVIGQSRDNKSEIRNPKQIPMTKGENDQNPWALPGGFWTFLHFGFWSLFRISDFGFRI